MNTYDVSISHRQPIEADKQKYGDRYIAPIYCRFVNRQLANLIMKRRFRLKNERNNRNEKFNIKENLTLQRRLLHDRARTELTSYRHQWVKNGSVFVKKSNDSRPIRLHSEVDLERLISEQNKSDSTNPITHRASYVNALRKQKSHREQFDFNRVAPILKNSRGLPDISSNVEFPPLPSILQNRTDTP